MANEIRIEDGEVWRKYLPGECTDADGPMIPGGSRQHAGSCSGKTEALRTLAGYCEKRMLAALTATFLIVLLALLLPNAARAQTALAVRPAPVPVNVDWLTTTNYYRATAGLAPVTENAAWSDGGRKHARYAVLNGATGHYEDPANPHYTPEGDAAARNGNVAYDSSSTTDREFVETWMTAPFHAVGILDPQLKRSGYGSYRDASAPSFGGAAALDVIRGLDYSVATARPVLWPADGTTVPLTRYNGAEYPDPLASCPGYASDAGLPLVLQLPEKVVGATSVVTDGSGKPIEHCRFDGSTYANPDTEARDLGRSVLAGRNAVVLIPRLPLRDGETYRVRVRTCAREVAWSFAAGDGVGDVAPSTGTPPAAPAPASCPAPVPAPDPAPVVVPAPPNVAPVITSLKPAAGSATRDRTPLVTAVVRDSGTNLQPSQLKVYVDGRKTRVSYSASTGRMKAQLPTLKPGKHTVKVTATDGILTTTVSSRFSIR